MTSICSPFTVFSREVVVARRASTMLADRSLDAVLGYVVEAADEGRDVARAPRAPPAAPGARRGNRVTLTRARLPSGKRARCGKALDHRAGTSTTTLGAMPCKLAAVADELVARHGEGFRRNRAVGPDASPADPRDVVVEERPASAHAGVERRVRGERLRRAPQLAASQVLGRCLAASKKILQYLPSSAMPMHGRQPRCGSSAFGRGPASARTS